MVTTGRTPISGSERRPVAGSRRVGRPNPDEVIRVTVVLRPRHAQEQRALIKRLGSQPPRERTYLKRREFETRFGSTPDELRKVTEFAQDSGLKVLESSSAKRSVVLSGTIGRLETAFGVSLATYTHPTKGSYRGRTGVVYLSPELAPLVNAVLGLDNRRQASAHIRFRPPASPGVSYTPPQIASLCDFPTGLDGSGQSVGILELGGGYSMKDIQTYCANLGIAPPSVATVSVDGATNSPTGDDNGPDGEVLLDIEIIGTVAPKAQILVYFAPNTDAGFVDGVNEAVHGQVAPGALSISWGSAESEWTSQGLQSLDQAFQDAATLGFTVLSASGDNGSSDGVDDGLAHVDFPASSQYVVGCGGTKISVARGKITGQVAWDDLPNGGATGGGVSDVFALPSWQTSAGVPSSANPGSRVGRGVPDVSADADPNTGYTILVDGSQIPVGGTSAVAPLWSGLLTLIGQSLGKPVGYINPILYANTSRGGFNDVISGNNGAYKAGPGWDACTGWGSPDGAKLLAALS